MADYQALLRTQVGRAILMLGTINSDIVFTRVTPGNYNPATGTTVDTTATVGPFKAPVVRLDRDDVADFPGKKNVKVALIPFTALAGYEPKMTDYMSIDGVTVEIARIRDVPTRAIYKVYVELP